MSDPQPAALAKGSMISVTQLFKVVPARLKFLKTERTEQGQCLDIVRRLALAWQSVGFHLKADDRVMLDLPACLPGQAGLRTRISVIMGQRFASEAMELDAVRDHISLKGQQQGPTGVGLQVRRPALKLLRLIQRPFAGGWLPALQAEAGFSLHSGQTGSLNLASAAENQQRCNDCDGSCHHETRRRFAVMMTQL